MTLATTWTWVHCWSSPSRGDRAHGGGPAHQGAARGEPGLVTARCSCRRSRPEDRAAVGTRCGPSSWPGCAATAGNPTVSGPTRAAGRREVPGDHPGRPRATVSRASWQSTAHAGSCARC
ncbi:hypothetical protein QJS66_04845 [Kocuria rhizophila]|nr:hypothetical protein QJS66_04845 [Kocuria rhizophila]